jgi:glycosyltransferase involved in cell wall biosynthesis
MERKKPHILVIHEKFGFCGGAEKIAYHLAEDLNEDFIFSFVYGEKTEQGKTAWDALFPTNYQIDFHKENGKEDGLESILHNIRPDLILVHKCENPIILEKIVTSHIPSIRWMHDHEVYCMRGYKYFPLSRKICTKKAGFCCLFPCLAFLKRDPASYCGFRYESYGRKQTIIQLDQRLTHHIVESHFMREELLRQGYDEENIDVIPYVPESFPQFSQPAIDNENLLLFIGQVVRGKGLDVLLESLKAVKTPFRLMVCGTGSYEQTCRRLAQKLGIAEKVEFAGFLPEHSIEKICARARALIVPSVWPEPFGLVGIESMRLGLPVIGFDSGGIREWLVNNENGILVPWMERKALCRAIETILQYPQYAHELGIQAKIGTEKFISSKTTRKQIKNLFLGNIGMGA